MVQTHGRTAATIAVWCPVRCWHRIVPSAPLERLRPARGSSRLSGPTKTNSKFICADAAHTDREAFAQTEYTTWYLCHGTLSIISDLIIERPGHLKQAERDFHSLGPLLIQTIFQNPFLTSTPDEDMDLEDEVLVSLRLTCLTPIFPLIADRKARVTPTLYAFP